MNKKIIIILFALMFAVTGCTTASHIADIEQIETTETTSLQIQTNEQNQSESVPKSGGTLKLSMRAPITLNPLLNEDVTVDNVLKLVFEPLFTLDKSQKVVPNLAQSYNLSEDGKSVTITLRNDIQWHDGINITAEDVIFSLDTIKTASEFSIYKNTLNNIANYNSAGNNTVVINFLQPDLMSMYNFCFPVIPRHYYRGNLNLENSINLKPLGSGLYKFSSYQIVREMILEKSSNFKGTPYIDNISVLIMPDKETDLYAFEQSVTDVIVTDISEWGKFSTSKITDTIPLNLNNFEFIGFNFQKEIFNNANIRKAIAYAVPSDEIISNIYLGNAVKSVTPVNPVSWYNTEEGIEKYEYDLTKAREFIKSTNLTKEQLTFSILVNSENNERMETAEIIMNNLNLIGMNVSIIEQNFQDYQTMLNEDKFDMFIGGVILSNTPDLRQLFLSSLQAPEGLNFFNYQDSQMDQLLGQVINAVGEENFKQQYSNLQKYISQQIPCIGIAFKSSLVLTGVRVKGEKEPTNNNIFNNIEKWYISE